MRLKKGGNHLKVKKEFWLTLSIITFILWAVVVSICIVDLYATRTYILEHMADIYMSLGDIWLELADIFTGIQI